jgi:hypothetical protein
MNSLYHFTQNWFEHNEDIWCGMLSDFENRPIKVLEIGSHEGRSTTFILDNYMYHRESFLHCIDPFLSEDTTSPVDDQTYEIFKRNISGQNTLIKSLFIKKNLKISYLYFFKRNESMT